MTSIGLNFKRAIEMGRFALRPNDTICRKHYLSSASPHLTALYSDAVARYEAVIADIAKAAVKNVD